MKKYFGNRYCVFARRNEFENWTDWTQVNNLDIAMKHVENIRKLNFLVKLKDREKGEVLVYD